VTLPRDDNDFDGVDPETRAPRLESLSTDPVEKLEAGNLHTWFWFDGRGREAVSDSASRPSSTGAPTMISRVILLAAIAIISVVAYFAGSGAFKSYST
jgi:hypothetical protein